MQYGIFYLELIVLKYLTCGIDVTFFSRATTVLFQQCKCSRKCEVIWYRYLARCTFSDVDQLCTLQMFLRSTLHVCMLCFVLHVCTCWC